MEETVGLGRLKANHVMNDVDEQTIEACQDGDPEAFRLVFEAYKDRVYSIAICYFNGDEASAKDITQDVFVKLMTGMSEFQSRSAFSTWLYRLVVNACLDRKRAIRRLFFFGRPSEMEIRDERKTIEDGFIQDEIEASVRAAIGTLKPKLRIAILLKYFDDLSYEEMALALGCSPGTVASRLNRAHEALGRKLAHLRSAIAPGE